MYEKKVIIGLGNQGGQYAGTRHNIGFDVVDRLASDLDVIFNKKKFGAMFGDRIISGWTLMLLKPQWYMNRSGEVVASAMRYFGISAEDIMVVTDDMALDVGRIRIRLKGSSGGHKGLGDIIEKLGTQEFGRIRVGIGKNEHQIASDYVLSRPRGEEKKLLDRAVDTTCQALRCWLKEGADKMMNEFNRQDKA
ncbi:MAG: aminoacyl-tRNA hydrolase [Planctomycetes bacterium]|nr:aminoacyl-tRNA hydrolase [Planctomycetota bacterium]